MSWSHYHWALALLEARGVLRCTVVPAGCDHNAHMYYVQLPDADTRNRVVRRLKDEGIGAIFHYIPLHGSPAGLKFGRSHGRLPITESVAARVLRLPLWIGITNAQISKVVDTLAKVLAK